MSAGILLIDGYNLLHAAGLAQPDYAPGELLRCRTRLLKLLLQGLSRSQIQTATIVFDARDPPPDRPAQVVVSGLTVLFANPKGDADAFIQEWIARHPSPRRITLVSSDRMLQRAARGYGAKVVSSGDFLSDLERRRAGQSSRQSDRALRPDDAKPAGRVSEAQMAYWLKVFGEVPAVDPDEVEETSVVRSPAPQVTPTKKPSTGRRPRRMRGNPRDDEKRAGKITPGEMGEWLHIFGGAPGAAASTAAPDELRLADLERWVKQFEATGEEIDQSRHSSKPARGRKRR